MPSFRQLSPADTRASRATGANRGKATRPEVVLRGALLERGLEFREHGDDLPGIPDFVFERGGLVVFCDGDFWHGRNWAERRARLSRGHNAGYWVKKISRNRARDRRVVRCLREQGWTVLRIWESDVMQDPTGAVESVNLLMRHSIIRRD